MLYIVSCSSLRSKSSLSRCRFFALKAKVPGREPNEKKSYTKNNRTQATIGLLLRSIPIPETCRYITNRNRGLLDADSLSR